MCVYVCVCVCVKLRTSAKERLSKDETKNKNKNSWTRGWQLSTSSVVILTGNLVFWQTNRRQQELPQSPQN